jgi:hypothetical protein
MFTPFSPVAVINGVKVFTHTWGDGTHRVWFKKQLETGIEIPYDGNFKTIENGLAWAKKVLED